MTHPAHNHGKPPPSNLPPPPPPSRDARSTLRGQIRPAWPLPSTLPAFAQALEQEELRPVRPEDFYDLENPLKQKELTENQRRTLFQQVFFEEHLTLNDLQPWRIRVAYRLIRELLRVYGSHENATLATLAPSATVADPWLSLRSNAPRRFCTGPASSLVPILDVADRLEPGGLPLLPPPVPANALVPYSPQDDHRLLLYVNALTTMAAYLGINEGTKTDPRLGKYGLLGLSNPLTVRLTFPTRLQLVQYERLIVQETLENLTRHGKLGTETILHEKYGFFDDEIGLMFRLAHQRATFLTHTDAEEDKAVMVLMLQDYIKRCRDTGAQRNELAALKALAVVQSITKIEPESINTEFEALIEKLADEPRPPLQLPMEG